MKRKTKVMVDISKFLDKKNKIAIVGASTNPEKYSWKLYEKLKLYGYFLYPVNPRCEDSIHGDKCFPNLESLPESPDVVIISLPPEMTEKIVEKCNEIGIRKIWMQPGSESEKAIIFCEENGIEVIHHSCFVVDGLKELI